MSDSQDMPTHRIEDAVESTQAKVIARLVTPALLAMLVGVLVWIGKGGMARLDRVVEDQASMRTSMTVLALRFDEVGLAQIKSHSGRLDLNEKKDIDQDRRLDSLERTVQTP